MWGCREHWFTLPAHLRRRIWSTYRKGQENTKNPSDNYIQAAKDVQAWIQQHLREQHLGELIPGLRIETAGRYEKSCKTCHAAVVMARVVDQERGGWKWGAFEKQPLTAQDGTLLFRRHRCPQDQQTPQRPETQRGLF